MNIDFDLTAAQTVVQMIRALVSVFIDVYRIIAAHSRDYVPSPAVTVI
jgi:hypothetical protein